MLKAPGIDAAATLPKGGNQGTEQQWASPKSQAHLFSFLEGLMTLQEGLELGSLLGDSLGALTSDLAGLRARGSGATLG